MNDTNDKIIRQIFIISFGLVVFTFFLVMVNQPEELEWEPPVKQETTSEYVERYVNDFTSLAEAFDSCGFYKWDFNADYTWKADMFKIQGNDSIYHASSLHHLQRQLQQGRDKYGLEFFVHRQNANFYRLIMSRKAHFAVLVMFRNDSIPQMDFINDSTAMDLSKPTAVRTAALKEHGVTHVSGRVWLDM